MTTLASYFARDVDEAEIPLIDDAYVTAEPDAAPELERNPLRPLAVLALLWYICHVAIVGAVIVTIKIDAEGYCTSPLQPIAAVPAALLLWAVTLLARWLARRER